jgi:hypothetical protein
MLSYKNAKLSLLYMSSYKNAKLSLLYMLSYKNAILEYILEGIGMDNVSIFVSKLVCFFLYVGRCSECVLVIT